jgi:diadenosine tetraphosphate (Ap4A) HIT family hydrolase
MDDARFPWLILVPEVAGISEPFDLSEWNQAVLWQESMRLSRFLKAYYQADKLNIAALGNQVSQLHLHHIARYHSDEAWPGPVWGIGTPEPYATEEATRLIGSLREGLALPLSLTLTA